MVNARPIRHTRYLHRLKRKEKKRQLAGISTKETKQGMCALIMPRLYPMEVDVLLQEDTNKERYRQVKVSREGVSTSEKNVVVVS